MDDDYWASCRVRGFSAVTIENDAGVLHRVLALLGLPAWEAAAEDVERVVGGTGGGRVGVVHSTGICAGVQGFHRFLQARKAVEIDALFGVRLVCPVDEFNASRHVGDDSPAVLPPGARPGPPRIWFSFLAVRRPAR